MDAADEALAVGSEDELTVKVDLMVADTTVPDLARIISKRDTSRDHWMMRLRICNAALRELRAGALKALLLYPRRRLWLKV